MVNSVEDHQTPKQNPCKFKHCENHANSNVSIDQLVPELNFQTEENPCEYCENTFNSNTEKKAECDYCDKDFKSQLNRKFEKKRVKCKHCDNDFINNLRVASLNICRGLFKKEEQLIKTINETKCDIIGVSEVDITDFDEKNPIVWKALEHTSH